MNLGEYVQELPQAKREQLYKSPWVCQALLRSLPPLAQQYIFNLLFVNKRLSADKISTWVVPSASKQHHDTVELLRSINLLKSTCDVSGREELYLHPSFQEQLSWGVRGGGQVVNPVPAEATAEVPSLDRLDQYAQERWEAMQLFLLTGVSSSAPQLPSFLRSQEGLDLRGLLASAGLTVKTEGGAVMVSEQGFRFLLKDSHGQLWVLLRQYIASVERKHTDEWAALMNFLMALGFRRVGQPYPWAGLRELEAKAAAHLAQLGLLYAYVVSKQVYYCPTRLAASLCGGYAGDSAGSRSLDGYIIVETNYRVYAYTSSNIQISILELFCRTDALLPNLYVGMITRESITKALDSGISAEMITGYLDQHAHPSIAHKVPCVPTVVTDQVRLWERQTQRVQTTEAVLYENFEVEALYERSLQCALQHGALLYSDPVGKRFIGSAAKHNLMKEFIKRAKQELLGGGLGGAPATRRSMGQ